MGYRLRDDVILEKVSGINLLVALRSAWGECPFALQIAPSFAYIWQCMKEGMDETQIKERLVTQRQFSEGKAEKLFGHFVRAAEELHYFSLEGTEL